MRVDTSNGVNVMIDGLMVAPQELSCIPIECSNKKLFKPDKVTVKFEMDISPEDYERLKKLSK
jgi:archaellum component FlaG (FlaF/FlaG flagellin family)